MDIQKEREVFEEWVDSEFNDHNWYLESKDQRNLHQYREELGDYWQYEETLLWSAWQAAQAIPEGFVVVSQKDLLELTIAINAVDLATHTESKTNEVREMWQQVALKLMALSISQEPAND